MCTCFLGYMWNMLSLSLTDAAEDMSSMLIVQKDRSKIEGLETERCTMLKSAFKVLLKFCYADRVTGMLNQIFLLITEILALLCT